MHARLCTPFFMNSEDSENENAIQNETKKLSSSSTKCTINDKTKPDNDVEDQDIRVKISEDMSSQSSNNTEKFDYKNTDNIQIKKGTGESSVSTEGDKKRVDDIKNEDVNETEDKKKENRIKASDSGDTNKKIKIEAIRPILLSLSPAEKQKIINKYKFNESIRDRFLVAFFNVLESNTVGTDYDKIAKISRNLVSDIVSINKIGDNTFIRSKIWNLQDKNNVHAENLYEERITSLEYINLTNDEMKSKVLKSKEEKIMHNSLMDSQFAKAQAETDIFKCGKCKNRKTTYHQLQTRSADEPMTTFVTCVVCNNRWKF